MKINIRRSIEGFYFFLLLFLVFFVKWYNNSQAIKYVSLLAFPLFFYKNRVSINRKKIIAIIMLIVYILLNILITKRHDFLWKEIILYIASPLGIMFFMGAYRDEIEKQNIQKFIFWFFNIYNVINFIIMVFQKNNSFFMMRVYHSNLLYGDQITGLIGINGTHRLVLFYITIIYLDLYFIKKNIFKKTATFLGAFNILSSVYISTFNDNRAYYYILLISLIPIFINEMTESKEKNMWLKTVFFIGIVILTAVLVFKFNVNVRKFVNKEIIERFFIRTKINLQAQEKTEERIVLFKYALEHGEGLRFGKGLGAVHIIGDPSMPRHFGMSEITSRVYNGGIIYVILLAYIYFNYIMDYSKIKINKYFKLYIGFVIVFLVAYQQIFSVNEETFLASLMFYYMLKYNDITMEKTD